MSRRVVLGKFGPGSTDWGLRISRPGFDAANATNSSLVSIDQLLFDSKEPQGTVIIHDTVAGLSVAANSSVTWTFSGTLAQFPVVLYRYYTSGSTVQFFGAEGPMSYQGYNQPVYGEDGIFYRATKTDVIFYNSYDVPATIAACVMLLEG